MSVGLREWLQRTAWIEYDPNYDVVPCEHCNRFGVVKLGGIPFTSGTEIESFGPMGRMLCFWCSGNKVLIQSKEVG